VNGGRFSSHPKVKTAEDGAALVTNTTPLALSAFGEVLTTIINPIVQIQFPYNINTRIVTPTVVGTGSVAQEESMAVLKTGTDTGSTAKMESKIVVRYNPGQGGVCKFTALFTEGAAGTQQEVGLGDNTDGLFVGFNGVEFIINRRQGGSNNFVNQSSFNMDTLDGDGPSGMILDTSKMNVFKIQFQWLGAGNLFFNIEDPVTGRFIMFHTIRYANNFIRPSLDNPTFPLRVFVDNGATVLDIVTKVGSMGGFTEGIVRDDGPINFSAVLGTAVSTTIIPVLSIRNKTTYQTKVNKVLIKLLNIGIINTGGKELLAQLILNGSLTDASFSSIDTNTSVMEEDSSASAITGGINLLPFLVKDSDSKDFDLLAEDIKLNPGDTLTIAAISTASGTTTDVDITWKEIF